MAIRKITEKTTTDSLANDAYVLITQTEEVDGENKHALRRIPFNALAAGLGADLDFDEDSQTLYIINPDGERIGVGTPIVAGISGLQMYTETDDTGTQYLILADSDGTELCRTEFSVSGGGSSTSYVCRLINGMSSLKLSFPSGQNCLLNYSFYEYYGNEQTTVNATAEVYVKTATTDYELARTDTVQQGSSSVDITSYLQPGTNYVKLQVTAGESGTVKVLVYTINVVDISLTSSFDATKAYTSSISFLYRVTGRNISKVMHFKIDDNPEWTTDIGTAHNVQLTETINLASYGHGDHVLKCWFVTGEGATSPVLTYDIMFDASAITPIISSVFDVDEVDYGDLITVQYVVFTHGSDYTAEVDRNIYTLDGSGNKEYFSQIALANVVNESMQTWNVSEYPSSGTIYLEIIAGSAKKVFAVTVNENTGDRDLSGVSTRLIAAYTASGRSNSDVNRAQMNATYTSIDEITTTIPGALTGFNWRSNGWMSDDDGYPVLRISGGAEANLNLPFFGTGWVDANNHTINLSGTPTGVGRTFEVAFATSGVTDEEDEIITIWDETNQIGVKIFPSRAYLLSSTMSVTKDANGNILNKNAIPYVPYSSAEKVRLSFVIEEVGHYVEAGEGNQNKQLIKVYVNGQMSKALAYTSDDFTSALAKPKMSANSCVLDVYSMRFYDHPLSAADVLKNYIADLPSIGERIEVYDKNAVVDDNGDINLDLARTQYPCMVLTGALSQYKGNKVKVGVLLYKPDATAAEEYVTVWEYMDKDDDDNYGNVNNVQGTSSQYYLKKNYKITFYRWNAAQGKFVKVKVSIFDDRVPVNTICIKADYMSPDSANTGNANFWQTVLAEPTPPQVEDARYQTSVMGYPMLVFQRDTASDTPSFIGRYNLNNDKSNSEAFGLEDDGDEGNATKCQKWEYLDNSENICNFLTDQLHALRTDTSGQYYEAWEDALESCYPDQGDLEDEGLRPNLDHIQIVYSWVCQRANFIDADTTSGTGGTYNGATYDTEYDLKLAIFRNEFQQHFNLHHTLHYFIANEVPLLVDNFAKNLFMTSYDVTGEQLVDINGTVLDINDYIVNGAVNIDQIDWENSTFAIWYPTLYDLDSCLGADNNGYDQFPYYSEMWDTYNNGYIVNGHSSLLWRLVYAAFYTELKALYCNFRDITNTLTPAKYLKAMIDDLTEALPVVSVNEDEQYKYIDAYEGGYYDRSANNGQGGWLYTLSYLYLVKGTMASYHRDFITKRFAMLDSKYMSDTYMQDCFNLRINRGQSNPEDLAFNVTPFQSLYCYTEWGNSGSYIGGKALEGQSIEMKPASSGNWSDIVLAIYGASHIKSLGDLSVLYPSKLQSLSLCSNLAELILGSDAQGYENSVLDSVADVSYLTMLQKLNICNCTALSGTVDLSNCDLIEEVYASGSAISAIVLPDGGYLTKLYLPGSITALNIISHGNLTNFGMDNYNSLLRLRVENTPNIPTDQILASRGTDLTRIRLVGVNWTLTSEAALRVLADNSMSSKAIDANGNNVNNDNTWPTVTGTVTINRIRGSLLTKLNQRYPDLVIHYTTKYHLVRFYNEGALWDSQEVNDNAAATTPTTPTKAATTQYVYSFSGWSSSYNTVTGDMTINAQFNASIQQYPIKFWEDDTKTTLLASLSNISFGQDFTYPNTLPTKSGNVFCGWQDANGNEYEYITQMPNASASIDSNGVPEDINLWPIWSPIQMVTVSKDFAALTPGERVFCAIAIQNGSADGVTINYYSETASYIIRRTDDTTVTASIAIADTKQWTLYNGETLTQRVLDFKHDYSDAAGQHPLGISFDMENCLTDRRQMNPSYKHAFNYQFGDEEAIVSDNNDHSSATDAALTHIHSVTADEVTAGFVDITALGPTYLKKIIVTHGDETTKTWHFDYEGFYGGSDMSAFTQNGAGQAVTSCAWYKSDVDVDADNPFYKIGKILQALGCDIVNWQGSIGLYGWATTGEQWATLTNQNVTLTDFGGLKIDTTGTDTLNTAANNPFNGNGKSRVTFCASYANDWNNFTEVSEGTVISVPVEAGDTVTVIAYGQSRNWGGWDNSVLCSWANGDFLDQLPLGLRSTIVPAYKKSSVGNRSYATQGNTYKMWLLSNAELNGYINNHPYMDEGTKYPIFTDNNSRLKYLEDGAGAVYSWWERSPSIYYSYYFSIVYTSGGPGNSYGASGTYGVSLGFCSGEATA